MADKPFIFTLPPKPAPEKTTMEKLETPLANLRGEKGSVQREASDLYAKEHPWAGGAMNTLADTISSMSSPASLGLGLLTGGSGLLEKAGLTKVPEVLHALMRAGGVGMGVHGGYKAGNAALDLAQGNGKSTPGDLFAGLAEGGMGALAAASKGPVKVENPNADYKTAKGLKVAVDALSELKKGNLQGPTMKPANWTGDPREIGHFYSDEPQMHTALDNHTLQQPKGAIAVKDIYGNSGRPDISVKDPKGQFKIVSKGLPIVEAEKAYQQGLTEVGKDVRNSNALEKAKGAEPKIVQQERVAKKDLLDLIEASKTRNLTNDEMVKIGKEIQQYPKGVVQDALSTLKKNASDLASKEDLAAKKNASDAAANIDVKQGQIDQLDAEVKRAQADSKTATKNTNTQKAQDQRTAQMEQGMLAKAQKFNADNATKRQAEVQAQAAQDAINEFKEGSDVKQGPVSVSESQTAKSPEGVNQTIRTSYNEMPPDKPAPTDAAPVEPTPADPSIFPKEGSRNRKQMIALANQLGGEARFNPKDGLHYVVPKGGAIPEVERMPAGPDRDYIANKLYTNKNEATTVAKLVGGELHTDGPRRYSIKFPEADVATDTGAPTQPELPEPTPIQEWANGGAAPKNNPSYATGDVPSNAALAEKPYDPNAAVDSVRGGLSRQEFARLNSINNGAYANKAEFQGEIQSLLAKQKEPFVPEGDNPPTGEAQAAPPAASTPALAEGGYPASWDEEPAQTSPLINDKGEAEPTLPGIEPTVNETPQVAEVPFALSGETTAPPTPSSPALIETAKPKVRAKAGKLPKLQDTQAGVDSLDILANAHGGELPTDLNPQGRGTLSSEVKVEPTLDDVMEQTGVTTGKTPFQPGATAKPRGLMLSSVENKAPGKLDWTRSPIEGNETAPEVPQATPEAPAEPAQAAAPEQDPYVVEAQKAIEDPATEPLAREALKRWLGDYLKEKGITFFPPDEGGGSTVSMFGAGQGAAIRRALKNSVPEGVQGPLSQFGTFVNNARRATLLNPYSVTKKGIGDIQALATAGIENPGQAGDILSNLFHGDTKEDFLSGWHAPTPGMEDAGKMNGLFQDAKNPLGWSGRTMSGLTNATKGVLTRSGFTPEQASAYTLTKTPSRPVTGDLYEFFSKPGTVQNHLNPFSRIALNWVEQGLEHSPVGLMDLITKADELSPEGKASIIKKALTGTGAGLAAYNFTPDDFVKEHPMASRMMTAGPLGLPILAGMALNNIRKDDTLPVGETIQGLLDELPGMRLTEDLRNPKGFARNYVSSYTNFAKPIAEALDPEEKDISSKDLTPFESLTNKAIANVPIARSTLDPKVEKKLSSLRLVF